MAVDTYRIAMGAYGWQYPAWSDDFYPEDLPEEWQLGFYGNEFPVVMFPADYWQQDDAIIAEWIEDSGETLKIICEFGSIEQFLASEERLNILDTRCYAIACKARGSELSVDIISSLSSKPWPVCVELSDDQDLLDSAVLDEMSSRGIGLVWQGNKMPPRFENSRLALTKIERQDVGMRDLRAVVETVLQQTSDSQQTVIIFCGDPPNIETIRNAQIMLELL